MRRCQFGSEVIVDFMGRKKKEAKSCSFNHSLGKGRYHALLESLQTGSLQHLFTPKHPKRLQTLINSPHLSMEDLQTSTEGEVIIREGFWGV